MAKKIYGTLTILIFIALVVSLMPKTTWSASKPIKLRMVGALNDKALVDYHYFWLIDEVKKRSKGALIIEHTGGPEAIPGREQFGAVRRGIVDIFMAPYTAWNGKEIPKGYIINLGNCAPEGKLPNHLFEWLVKVHEEKGLRFLGMSRFYFPFHHFLTKKVEKLDDLKGLKIRSGGVPHVATQKQLGMVPIFTPVPEIYTAMERGVVDGFTMYLGAYKFGLTEVTKYIINPPYKIGAGPAFAMNLKKWKKLPPDLQDVLIEIMTELGPMQYAFDIKQYKKEQQIWKDAGVQFIDFKGDDAKKVSTYYDEFLWNKMIKPNVTAEELKMLQESIKP